MVRSRYAQFFEERERPSFGLLGDFGSHCIRVAEGHTSGGYALLDLVDPERNELLAQVLSGELERVLDVKARGAVQDGVVDALRMVSRGDGQDAIILSLEKDVIIRSMRP